MIPGARGRAGLLRRLPLVLAWLALVAMVVATLAGGDRSRPPRADTQRMRVIPLDHPVAFALDPDEEQVKLVAWLAAPPRWARDVRAWASFQLDLSVLDDQGRVVWRGEAWRRTRTSWLRRDDGSLLRTSWLPHSRMEVHDSRNTVVDVAGLVPAGGQLVVQAHSPTPGATVMVAAFRHAWRTRAAQLRVLAGAEPSHTEALASRVTEEGWDSLPEGWRQRLSERLWERLPALPRQEGLNPGSQDQGSQDQGSQDQGTLQLLTARAEAPWEDQPALGLPVPPGGAVAWNLRQGARLHLTWRDASGRALLAAPTWLQLVHVDGTTEVRFLGVVDTWGPVVVDEPLVSVQFALDPQTEGPRVVQVRVEGAETPPIWGDPAVSPLPTGQGWLVAPDLRALEMVRTSAELGPVDFPLDAPAQDAPAQDDPASLLRLSFRPRLPPAPLTAFGLTWDAAADRTVELPAEALPPLLVEVIALDAAGAELERFATAIGVRPSAFERYGQADDPGTARVGEVETRYLVPPAGCARLRISAAAPVDVALRAFSPDHPTAGVARGYELPVELAPPPSRAGPRRVPAWQAGRLRPSPGFSLARFEPYAQDPWQAQGPADRAALQRADRLVRVDTQVRLDAVEAWLPEDRWLGLGDEASEAVAGLSGTRSGQPGAQAPAQDRQAPPVRNALALSGPYELLVEPDRDGRTARGTRALLGPEPSRVEVPASGRLDVDYRLPSGQAGGEVILEVDGQPFPQRLLASAGRLRLADLTPGPRQVAARREGGTGADLFLARAPGARAWQVRRVVRLAPGETRAIPVPGGPHSVALHTYGAAGWLEWRLEGGGVASTPAMMERATRRSGRHRLTPDGGRARPLSFSAAEPARLRPFVLEIGSDVGTEPLSLVLRLTGTDQPVWLRATATWARAPIQGASRSRVVDR